MSWLTGGPAMAKDGALADACRAQSHDVTGRDVTSHDVTGRDLTGGLTTLPAAGVLSIADAAGAAAGQGRNSLPTGSATVARTVPGPAALPAVPGPRTLPGTMPGAAPGAAKAAPAAPAVPGGTTALPAPADAKTLPADATTLSAPAKAVSAPVHNAVAGATTVSEPRRAPAVPAADAKTLFPARSTVPLLSVAPAKPSAANACAPQALRTAPAAREREHPLAQGHQKKSHRHPKPQDEPAGSASRGDSAQGSVPQKPGAQKPGAQNAGAQNSGAQKPEARNQGAQGALASQGESHSTSSQSGASGQEHSTQTFPVKDRRHRKAHHPHKQPGVTAPAQAANQAANQSANQPAPRAGQAGRPVTGTRNASLPEGERKKGAKDKRRRNDDARGRSAAAGVQPDAADGRHVPRLREYPKAASRQQNGDITAPAALTKAAGTRAVTDFATATGKKLLP